MEETRFTLRLPTDLKAKLDAIGQTEERSLNWQIVQAIREYVKRKAQEKGGKRDEPENL